MAYMKISCEYCGGSWEVYERDDWTSSKAATCPHCAQKIDHQTWRRCVLPSFGAFADMNKDLCRNHVDDHHPLFQIDMINDLLFKNRHDIDASMNMVTIVEQQAQG